MDGNKVKAAAGFEQTLDVVLALHNFKVLRGRNQEFDIPRRRAPILGDHIFHPIVPEKDVDLKIPEDPPNLSLPKFRHIDRFIQFLPSAVKGIKEALERQGKECIFFPVVLERARNLFNGAYVLQLQVQDEGLDTWSVKYLVGASYSYETHVGYFTLAKDAAAAGHICDCFSGYCSLVIGGHMLMFRFCVLWSLLGEVALLTFFFSARACSHLGACLMLLLAMNDPEWEAVVVRPN